MREIKFRAWDKNKKVFIPTEVWAVVQTDFNAFGIMLLDWQDYKEGEYFYDYAQELQQFTGLKDRNGVEIYESDIIGKHNPRSPLEMIWGTVVYVAPSFQITVSESQSSLYTKEWIEDCVILGNIYEHPNLLTNE